MKLFKGGGDVHIRNPLRGYNTTELISIYPPYARKGPVTLPHGLNNHCSLLVGDKIFLIGQEKYSTSYNRNLNLVLSININNGEIEVMKDTIKGHYRHGCASFSQGNKTFIAVAGGSSYSNADTTEIYDVQENVWKSGNARFSTHNFFLKSEFQFSIQDLLYLSIATVGKCSHHPEAMALSSLGWIAEICMRSLITLKMYFLSWLLNQMEL